MKILLSNFAAHIPSIPQSIEMFTGMIPPIIVTGGKIELDYAALLFFDRLLMDRQCYERILSLDIEPFARLRSSLKILNDEGYLELVNFADISKKHQARIKDIAKVASKDIDTWLPEMRAQINNWEIVKPEMKRALGKYFTDWDEYSMGLACFCFEQSGKIDHKEVARLKKIVTANKIKRNAAEKEILSQVLIPFLEMTHLNLIVGEEALCPNIYDWQTLDGFYKKKFEYHMLKNYETEKIGINAMREFFNLAFYPFAPKSALEWIALLKDPRIQTLREKVIEIKKSGENFDPEYAARSLASFADAQTKLSKIQKIVGYITLPLEFIPFPVDRVIEEVIMRYYENKLLKGHRWLYFSSKLIKEKP